LIIPAANIDEYVPADIARVEVYGYTGRSAPPRARWVELSTLVATVPVGHPPLKPGEKPDSTRKDSRPANAPLQGAMISVRDTLTPDELVQGREAAVRDPQSAIRDPESAVRDPESAVRDPQSAVRDPQTVGGDPASGSRTADRGSRLADQPLKRYYTAVPFNAKGRPGPPGGVAEFPLLPTPDPPPSVTARYTDRSILLEWEPSGGLIGFLLERVLADDAPPLEVEEGTETVSAETPGPLMYNVYREIPPDPFEPPGPTQADWREEPPTPITSAPVATLTFTDNVEFGRRRCYSVRAVRGLGPEPRVGDASPPACFTAIDTFPPAPPHAVTTVASEGFISLIWEPNTELDLAGYVVLRAEAPGELLSPLTSAPIPSPSYRDDKVAAGVRYVYAVIAVDNRFPLPNVSATSDRVEETAR
jgi:hypothetical protein